MKKQLKKITPNFLLSLYHYLLALMGAFFYRFPSKKMVIVGVTGTSGKTTVVDMIGNILEEAGYKTAVLSSIKFKIGRKEEENKLKVTMPGRMVIQKFLRKAKKEGIQYAVLEVTSEGIKQHRQAFIDFDVAILTNLSPEHIESHGGFEKYKAAKGKFFKRVNNIHIINLDDKNASYFLQFKSKRKFCYGMGLNKIDNEKGIKLIQPKNLEVSPQGIKFQIKGVPFNLNFLGKFNAYNALAAISFAISQDISLLVSKKALEKMKGMPGRMEIIAKEPTIIVDYAHTPVALENVYQTVKGLMLPSSKIICVLGSCGGGRDKWKRPVLGSIAADYCDEVIITNEDPYDEDPMAIIEDVAKGTKGKGRKILDRRLAINKAIKLAKKSDIVIITGKGSEPLMCLKNGKKIAWDDRQVAIEELSKKEEN